jgi:hypothetical protein
MYYRDSPQALIKLRKAFNESGYREQERAITYAINRSGYGLNRRVDFSVLELVEITFKYVFFDLPTQWGMSPGRALRVLVVLIGVFSFPYILALRYPGSGRIYRKWGAENPPITASVRRSKNRPAPSAKVDIEPLQYSWIKDITKR